MPMYYRNAHTVILVYDIQSRESFNNLNKYLNILYTNCEEMPFVVLLGNKKDQKTERQVQDIDIRELCEEYEDIDMCEEVSAKCDPSFDKILNKICSNLLNIFTNIPSNQNIRIKNKKNHRIKRKASLKNWFKCGAKDIS